MMDKYYHMRLCGGTWMYCDGECETCTRGHFSASNHTEEKRTEGLLYATIDEIIDATEG